MSRIAPPPLPEEQEKAGRPPLQVLLAAPRGFCAGVQRAIDAVVHALDRFGAPVYVRRAIVHNLAVVRSLEAQGAIFVQELDEVPEGSVVILSAHGVPRTVVAEARARRLRHFDAICPLVAKVHREVARHHDEGRPVVLIGHHGHPEIVGTMGQVPEGAVALVSSPAEVEALSIERTRPVGYAVQTTFSADEADGIVRAIEARFLDVKAPPASDICYATTNRQAAVKALAPRVDAMIVAGESFSSNACRLAEVARASGCPSVQLVADAEDIDWAPLRGCHSIGVTAAASTPDSSVSAILDALGERFDLGMEEVGAGLETAVFKPVRIA